MSPNHPQALAFAVAAILFVGMIGAFVVGRYHGSRFRDRAPEGFDAGIQTVNAALFALLGLLLAFTFTGAAERFDERRKLIVEEANAVGTAYRRIALLPAAAQPGLRAEFARYVDARLMTYRVLPDAEGARRALRESEAIQDAIWNDALAALKTADNSSATMLVVNALNPMFDIETTRAAATEIHPPPIVFVMLATLAMVATLLVGFEMAKVKRFSSLHVMALAATTVFTICVILDYEYPRMGWIRIDTMDHWLVDVRSKMK